MSREMIKSIALTLIIFGGLGLYLFRKPMHEHWNSRTELGSKQESLSKSSKTKVTKSKGPPSGTVIDQYKGVKVYYNGSVKNVSGRNTTPDGYNLGLKYQCVEFAKRFYYQIYGHRMPDSYGHAKDFFDSTLGDGEFNSERGMTQYLNRTKIRPRKDDLVVIGASKNNAFGHLIIITDVGLDYVEFIQQNPGPGNASRGQYALVKEGAYWKIDVPNLLGWLRL